MNQYKVNLLDLPNEMLLLILKKLDNIDVLYSLLGINNQRLDIIVQEEIFTNILTFVSTSQSTDEISSISDSIINRFNIDILPRIHKNVRSLILEPISMECILGAGNYPNLTELKIFNFNKAIVSRYFNDDSLIGNICKQQITDLTLISNENNIEITRDEYTKNVYEIIFTFFKNLKHLNIMSSSINDYSPISLCISSSLTFSSSTLTTLCVNVNNFDDCLALLDGRFKQLTTLIVQIDYIRRSRSQSYNMDGLPNLECFSLICYNYTEEYENRIVPVLQRMSHLKKLTLNLRILNGSTFISGTHLDNEILIHMLQLHTFTFYFASKNGVDDSAVRISDSDIKRTFTNIEHREVASIVDYCNSVRMICHVFSLPFKFDRLFDITNNIPNIVFNSVTHLKLNDKYPFKHEFFIRLTRLFPILKSLSINTILSPNCAYPGRDPLHNWHSIVEYPHLVSLDIDHADTYYAEHFLNETKAYLPRLTELKIRYKDLKMVTTNFTRDETRRHCTGVKRLIVEDSTVYSKDVYYYFPSLSI